MYAHVILAKNRHDRGDNVQALKHAIDAVEAGYRIFPGAKKAKRIYYRVMENRPFLRTLNMQALCLHGLGRLDEAIHVAKKLLKLNPQDDQTIQPFLVSWAVQ